MSTDQAWFDSLTDSVFALGAAAREAQRAARTADLDCASWDIDRLRYVDGHIRREPRAGSTIPVRPHDDAVFAIHSAHLEHAFRLRGLYAKAALEYAYGTAWALWQLLAGEHPEAVLLERTPEGDLIIPRELCPVPPEEPELGRWRDYSKMVAALKRWRACDLAAMTADELAEQPDLTDHEAFELHEAIDTASALPDAMYAYGALAEQVLSLARTIAGSQISPAA